MRRPLGRFRLDEAANRPVKSDSGGVRQADPHLGARDGGFLLLLGSAYVCSSVMVFVDLLAPSPEVVNDAPLIVTFPLKPATWRRLSRCRGWRR